MPEPSATRSGLTLADAYRFFAPLILMTELNMISKSAIHAFLARTDAPGPTLAAFNTVFTFYYAITSATEVTAPLALAYLHSRRDLARLAVFMTLVVGVPCALVSLTAFTTLGDWFYGEIFGLGRRATADARTAAGILLVSAPVLIARGLAFALLMRARRTLLISGATVVRLGSLAGSLAVWPLVLDGAAIGAAALVTCMAVEAVFAWVFAWRYAIRLNPNPTDGPLRWLGLWRFSWPLALNQSAELGVVFTINIFLGRLPGAELALAAFGVAHGLAGLLLGPVRNLAHAAQTLVASRADFAIMVRFSIQLVVLSTVACVALFNTGLRAPLLRDIMGLDAQLAAACSPALVFISGVCAFWAFAALFRGMLASARTTGTLALTAGLRIGVAALVAAVGLTVAGLEGAVLGMAAWIASYAIETLVTGVRLHRLGWYVASQERR